MLKSPWRFLAGVAFLSTGALAQDILIQNITLVSPHLADDVPNANVWITNGIITQVSVQPVSAASPSTRVIDGEGKFLSPGIMDSHIHADSIPGIGFLNSDKAREQPALVKDYLTQLPRSMLYYGITQVLNLGASDGKSAFTRGSLHPDYFSCQPIPVIGGYPHLSAEFTLRHTRYFILEENAELSLPEGVDPANHTVEVVVKSIADTGSPCIKVYIEDGFGAASDWPLLADPTLTKIRQEADKYGLQVWAHANAIDMYHIALGHDVDGLAHGLWNWQWLDDPDNPPVTETLDSVISSSTAYMPTIQVMLSLQGMYDEAVLNDPRRKKVMPASLLNWYQTNDGQWFKTEITRDFGDPPDNIVHKLTGYGVQRARQAASYLADKGYPLLLASDFPSSPSFAASPGLSTYYEMEQMADAGISAAQIFAAATINGPRQFGLDEQYGSIEPGKVANLLILDKNPRLKVSNWLTIDTIVLHGTAIKREDLAVNSH